MTIRCAFPISLGRIMSVLILLHSLNTAVWAATALSSGVKASFSLPAVTDPTLFAADFGYTMFVPVGATRLKIDMESQGPANVDLVAKFGSDVAFVNGAVVGDFVSQELAGPESIVINQPQPGTYFIGLALLTANVQVSGSLTATVTLQSNEMIVPQFVNGGGWTTSLFLSNVSAFPEDYTIRFFDNAGAPRQVPLVGLGSRDSINGSLNPGQVAIFEASDTGALVAGWADIKPATSTSNRLNGFTVFRYRAAGTSDSEAIVTPGTVNDRSFVVVFDNVNGFSTGVALVNPNSTSTSIAIFVRDQNGGNVTSETLTLGANSQISFFTKDHYPSIADKKGSLLISAAAGFSAVGLRFSPGFTSFTSFPPLK
jgi:hypothetical protein